LNRRFCPLTSDHESSSHPPNLLIRSQQSEQVREVILHLADSFHPLSDGFRPPTSCFGPSAIGFVVQIAILSRKFSEVFESVSAVSEVSKKYQKYQQRSSQQYPAVSRQFSVPKSQFPFEKPSKGFASSPHPPNIVSHPPKTHHTLFSHVFTRIAVQHHPFSLLFICWLGFPAHGSCRTFIW
jgi:hypothetical protein